MSCTIRKYQGVKYSVDIEQVEDSIPVEVPLYISINGTSFSITMCSPDQLKELVVGLLFSESVISSLKNVVIEVSDADGQYNANLSGPEDEVEIDVSNSRNLLSVSSCGICGRTELPKIEGDSVSVGSIDVSKIKHHMSDLWNRQKIFKSTGGTHGAILMDKDFGFLTFAEDIGRHNAVDKCIGAALIQGKLGNSKILIVSSRISYEIIVKCFRAKVSTIIAVSAPTSLAIDFAKELGIALYAFSREGRVTCFSNPFM